MKANGHGRTQETVIAPVGEAPKLERLLTPEEAAELLQVPVSWMYQHTRRRSLDRIPFVKVGHYVRFREEDLLSYINRRMVEG